MATTDLSESRYSNAVRLILIAALVLMGLWFTYEVINIVFFFFFAVVLTLILNAPTMWLVSKKVPRTVAALLVFAALLIFLVLIGWLVIPRMLEQLTQLVTNVPLYYQNLKTELSGLLADYPSLQKKLLTGKSLQNELPSVVNIVTRLGNFSLSIVSGLFFLIMFFSVVVYMLISPAPLIETYLLFFSPKNRPKAGRALARASKMVVGWMWSNVVVGSIEAVATFAFLSYMGIPGVWVWAGLALFAEMVPKLGLYIMAIPPTLVALSIDPVTALWVLVFFLALNELAGDFITPHVRASTMNLHPVSSLLVMLAMVSAFGLVGALIATPLTAFIKAYYEEFYLASTSSENVAEQVDVVLKRDV
ncbi:AI-2E family transporter [Fibrella sp. HMF5335]|uniref:AI-2E family transporter n=1 Tax=Fibrella rubiginis TaxID=2817060 RepID=A0A939GF71_9BACT|nr:AI-2E family transporter [Fibrella rubiginis]MBO0936380.1 AI-2E family transporter [Fibrella rubiginis]